MYACESKYLENDLTRTRRCRCCKQGLTLSSSLSTGVHGRHPYLLVAVKASDSEVVHGNAREAQRAVCECCC